MMERELTLEAIEASTQALWHMCGPLDMYFFKLESLFICLF